MIKVVVNTGCSEDYLQWVFHQNEKGDCFKTKDEAISYLLRFGFNDLEIAEMQFIVC